jgi:hypothetical protein
LVTITSCLDAAINSDLVIDGSVKNHDEWNEIQQTQLTRVKIVKVLTREDAGADSH